MPTSTHSLSQLRRLTIALVLPLLAACGSEPAPVELGSDLSIPEIKGTKLYAGAYGNLPPAISSDSLQIAFVGGPADRILLVSQKGGTLQSVPAGATIHGVAAAGRDFYWIQETDSSRYSLFRWLGQRSEIVTDNAALLTAQWPADGLAVVGTPDGKTVAFVAKPDSLMIYTPATSSTRFVRSGCDQVVAMSPDGLAVICLQRLTRTYVTYNTATGAVRTDISLPYDVQTRAHEIRWDATSGVRVLYAETGRYLLYDETNDQRLALGDVVVSPISLGVSQTALSPDGTHVAFWQIFCAQKSGDNCVKNQGFLMVYDLRLGGLRRAAIHTLPSGVRTGSALAFSSTGHELYYVVGSDLFVISV